MSIFYSVLLNLAVSIYTGLFAYSLHKDGNKKGMIAVVCLIIILITSSIILYLT